MPITVEANLRIPSLRVQSADGPDRRVDNASVRFLKRIAVDAIPKIGDTLRLSTQSGGSFDGTVTRVDWDEGKDLFVVSCLYARRSITATEHDTLRADPEWRASQLP